MSDKNQIEEENKTKSIEELYEILIGKIDLGEGFDFSNHTSWIDYISDDYKTNGLQNK